MGGEGREVEGGEGRGGKGEGREMDPPNFENRSTPMPLQFVCDAWSQTSMLL